MRAAPAIALLATALAARAGPPTPAEAFSQGHALGAAGGPAVAGAITSGAAAEVPLYSPTQPQAGLFGRGNALLAPQGAGQVSDCQSRAPDPDGRRQQQCEATNFLARKSQSAAFTIAPGDPVLVRGRAVSGDPGSILGNLSGTYSACTPRQVSAPARTQTETCTESRTPASVACQKILTVRVDRSPTCVAGAWSYAYGPNTIAGVYCDPNRLDAMLVGVYAYGAPEWQGQCPDNPWRYAYVPRTVATTELIGTLNPHWWSFCNTVPAKVIAGSGCVNGNCTYTFTFEAAYATYWVPVNLLAPDPTYTVTDAWDNQCATLEARLP